MNKVLISEWKGLYPVKKCLLICLECFLILTSVAGTLRLDRNETATDYVIWFGFIISAILFFPVVIRYTGAFYRCLPVLLSHKNRKTLVGQINEEDFVRLNMLEDSIWKDTVFMSENWFRIKNHYIPKAGIVKMWTNFNGTSMAKRHVFVGFLFVTGEIFQRELTVLTGFTPEKDYGKYITRAETSLNQVLQDNTYGIGIIYPYGMSKKKFIERELRADIQLIREYLSAHANESDLWEAVAGKKELQTKLVDMIRENDIQDPGYKDKVWTERWKNIPYYKEYVQEKWRR